MAPASDIASHTCAVSDDHRSGNANRRMRTSRREPLPDANIGGANRVERRRSVPPRATAPRPRSRAGSEAGGLSAWCLTSASRFIEGAERAETRAGVERTGLWSATPSTPRSSFTEAPQETDRTAVPVASPPVEFAGEIERPRAPPSRTRAFDLTGELDRQAARPRRPAGPPATPGVHGAGSQRFRDLRVSA